MSRKPVPIWLIVVASAVPALVLGAVGGGLVGYVAGKGPAVARGGPILQHPAPEPVKNGKPPAAKQTEPLDAAGWRALLLGKTPEQVVQLVGPPVIIQPLVAGGPPVWQLRVGLIARDGQTKQTNITAKFDGGVCVDVGSLW